MEHIPQGDKYFYTNVSHKEEPFHIPLSRLVQDQCNSSSGSVAVGFYHRGNTFHILHILQDDISCYICDSDMKASSYTHSHIETHHFSNLIPPGSPHLHRLSSPAFSHKSMKHHLSKPCKDHKDLHGIYSHSNGAHIRGASRTAFHMIQLNSGQSISLLSLFYHMDRAEEGPLLCKLRKDLDDIEEYMYVSKEPVLSCYRCQVVFHMVLHMNVG